MFDKWLLRVAAIGSALGGFAGFLYWAGIKPKDLHMSGMALPHAAPLLLGLLLFAFSIALSLYSIYGGRSSLQRAEGEASDYKSRYKVGTEEYDRLNRKHTELMETFSKTSAELELMDGRLVEAGGEIRGLKGEVEKLQDDNADLKRQLDAKDEECQEKLRTSLHLLGASEQTNEDPRVYLGMEERKFGPLNQDIQAVFIASNQGGTEARDIEITFPLSTGVVAFRPVDVVAAKERAEIVPVIVGERWPSDKHDFLAALSKQPNPDFSQEVEFSFTVAYKNHTRKRRFDCPMTLLFKPFHHSMKRNRSLENGFDTFEIKHGDCKVTVV